MVKHTEKKKETKKNSITNVIVFSIIILVFASFIVYSFVIKNNGISPERVAQCLSDKGAKLYTSQYCPHCQEQKKMFGDALSKLDIAECSTQIEECQNAGITAYPTWIINGRKFLGTKDMNTLYDLSDCKN